MAKRTSLVLVCWQQLFDVLDQASWPAHPVVGTPPAVAFGGTRDVFDEMVIVPGRTDTRSASQSWATMGRPSKDEAFTLDVNIWTAVPGTTATGAKDRIADLVAVVEGALRDQTTGLPAGITLTAADGIVSWGVVDIVPAVGPLDTEGFGASCRIEVGFKTRL